MDNYFYKSLSTEQFYPHCETPTWFWSQAAVYLDFSEDNPKFLQRQWKNL